MIINGRTFVISGGASGLGLAAAHTLHAAGAQIALLDVNEENGQKAAAALGKERARFFQIDVSDTESVESCVKNVLEWVKSTGCEIGGIVAAAGVGNPGKIIDRERTPLSLDSFDFVININLRGTVDLVRNLLPAIAANAPLAEADNERGIVIMVSSVAAYDGQPGQLSYSASKGAIASMTLPMARDLASHGIRVVTIAPGVFESAMTKMMSGKVRKSLESVMEFPKRMGTGEEFARFVKDVIENRMLNATVIRLDAGVRMPSKI